MNPLSPFIITIEFWLALFKPGHFADPKQKIESAQILQLRRGGRE